MTSALLTLAEVAARLGCSKTTAWRLIRSGAIPSVRLTERLRHVDPVDLENFIEERRERGPSATVIELRRDEAGPPS